MKKEFARRDNELRPQYDLTLLGEGVRGKYYKQATSGSNLVLLDSDVARAFPDSTSVNQALRLLQSVAARTTKHRPKPRRKTTG